MPRCPVCDAPVFLRPTAERPATPTAPFCSDRCKTIDLGRWLEESYSVPHVGRVDDDEELAEGHDQTLVSQ
jgi:endogenous inhibitor of DNA gyrase (YacG/DUF329 family)